MRRLHSAWVRLHPELNCPQQRLRNYVAHLRQIGYARAPDRVEAVQSPEPLPARLSRRSLMVAAQGDVDLSTRTGNLRSFIPVQPKDLALVERALDRDLPEDADIWQINCAVYSAATELLSEHRQERVPDPSVGIRRRIEKCTAKIKSARQHASRIECVMHYIQSGRQFTPKVCSVARKLRQQHHTLSAGVLLTIKQHCLERIRALVAVRKSLMRQARRVTDNHRFRINPSRLFKPTQVVVENPPALPDVKRFWKEIYEVSRPFHEDTPAIAGFDAFAEAHSSPVEVSDEVTEEEVKGALKGARNFSAPGPDGIPNIWWKRFTCVHRRLARVFNSWLNEGTTIPQWVVEGKTVLIPKSGDLSNPKNYRPITCLNTLYKTFTRVLYVRLLGAVGPAFEAINEQRGGKKGASGCKDNLLIDRCITQDARLYLRNLSMAWIDYRKAFDTTSHELMLHLLGRLAVPPQLRRCIKQLLPLWRTRFVISAGDRVESTEPIRYRRGVFQGDSLSPLLFCISMLPLSVLLRQTRGYNCGPPASRRHKVTHLFYMDDLKIYAAGQSDLRNALRLVEDYSRDIGMELGLDKCAVFHLRRGRSNEVSVDAQLQDGGILKHLGAEETYAYLGVEQSGTQCALKTKKSLSDKYCQLLRRIWNSELSGPNKVAATNILAVPILQYSFGVLRWNQDELRKLDIETRKRMQLCHSLHPRSSVLRIYLPRRLGGRGLLNLECLHDRVVLGAAISVIKSSDPLMRFVEHHEQEGVGAFLFGAAARAAERLGLDFEPGRGARGINADLDLTPSRLSAYLRKTEEGLRYRQNAERPVHGNFYRLMEERGLSAKWTFQFLRSKTLRSESEAQIVACQDGVVNTLVYRRRVIGEDVPNVNCRACHEKPETLVHILSACRVYAPTGYTNRHNAALRVLYYHLRHSYKVDETPVLPHAPREIEQVVENGDCRLYWNFVFTTVSPVEANRPDILLLDKTSRTMYLIEFSAPADNNVVRKEEEKRLKYLPLAAELERLYPRHKVRIVVLVIGCLGGIRPTLLCELRKIPHCTSSAIAAELAGRMQQSVVLGSIRMVRDHGITAAQLH